VNDFDFHLFSNLLAYSAVLSEGLKSLLKKSSVDLQGLKPHYIGSFGGTAKPSPSG
jgi:hypothetical protein